MTAAHRAGVVALVGRPNAGKSTLLNRLLGARLAIVTARPQTTRSRILGIVSRPGAQVLLVDTPGAHEGRGALHEAMHAAVAEAVADCDVALLLVDRARGWGDAQDALRARIEAAGRPWILVGTKADLQRAREGPWPPPEAGVPDASGAGPPGASRAGVPDAVQSVSAETGEGVAALLDAVVARLPESPPYYPDDALTDRPLRFLAAEMVREAAFEVLEEEVPYDLAVEVESFDESRADRARVRANLLVRRASQKAIVIGAGGRQVKEIGVRARRRIERFMSQRVHLKLWVKVDPAWSRKRNRLKDLGYS